MKRKGGAISNVNANIDKSDGVVVVVDCQHVVFSPIQVNYCPIVLAFQFVFLVSAVFRVTSKTKGVGDVMEISTRGRAGI